MELITSRSGAENRPLATFAVFAFNQERYIRETIDAAFAQRYSPLEIILSDDCSSDRTFAIMQEIAATYDGPHSVRLHRSPENLGLVNHVITVARMALGEYLIVNAGDDISYPERSEIIIETFIDTRADCINSSYDEIDEFGTLVTRDKKFVPSPSTQRVFAGSVIAKRKDDIVQSAIGFAASYRREFWADLPFSKVKLNIEDGLATLLLNCKGATFISLSESLIRYRVHRNSLSLRQANDNKRDSILSRERKISDGGKQIVSTIDYIMKYLDVTNIVVEPSVIRELKKSAHYGSIVSDFWDDGKLGRLNRLLKSRRKAEFLFVVPRIFGQALFLRLKVIAMFAGDAARRLSGSQPC